MKHLILISLLFFAACAQTPKKKTEGLQESGVAVTDSLTGARYSNIYFTGQPADKDWETLKKEGFTHVINLRTAEEYDEKKEEGQVEKAGLRYSHFPMDVKENLTQDQVSLITSAVVAHRKEGKTLIHCGSGNRAGYWAGAHFYLDHDYSKDDSVQMAKQLGMTSPKLEEKLVKFIDKAPKKQ